MQKNLAAILILIIALILPATALAQQETSTAIQLHKGWNLVSFPFAKITSLAAPATVTRALTYDAASKKYYIASLSTPSSLDASKGLWVRATGESTITATGTNPTKYQQKLVKGWNLIAGAAIETPLDQISNSNAVAKLFEYDPQANEFVTATALEPGKAYFAKVTIDTILSATYPTPVTSPIPTDPCYGLGDGFTYNSETGYCEKGGPVPSPQPIIYPSPSPSAAPSPVASASPWPTAAPLVCGPGETKRAIRQLGYDAHGNIEYQSLCFYEPIGQCPDGCEPAGCEGPNPDVLCQCPNDEAHKSIGGSCDGHSETQEYCWLPGPYCKTTDAFGQDATYAITALTGSSNFCYNFGGTGYCVNPAYPLGTAKN